jgi:outer membrane protein assembly factor BamB
MHNSRFQIQMTSRQERIDTAAFLGNLRGMKMSQPAVVICFLFLLASGFNACALDWYRWRGPDQNGISKETGWLAKWPDEGPRQLWKTSVGTGFSSVSISNGKIYTMGHDGQKTETVYCFDAATGALVWKHSYPGDLDPKYYEGGTSCTPTVDGGCVYTLARHGDFFCFDAAKGDVLWSTNVNKDMGYKIPMWGFAGSPVVDGDTILLNVGSAGLAFDKKSHDVIWHSDTSMASYSTPVLMKDAGGDIAVLHGPKSVEAFRVSDGKVLWEYPWVTHYDMNIADAVLGDGKFFVSSDYDHGCALVDISKAAPEKLWENKNMRNHIATCVLWNGFIYGVDNLSGSKCALKCLDWKTGDEKWSEPTFGKGSLMMADGKIIGLSDSGELMTIDPSPESCKVISRAQVLGGKCWTTPVLSNGRIYCRNAKGDLLCLDVSGK